MSSTIDESDAKSGSECGEPSKKIRFMQVDDDKCVLIKFANEENKIATCFEVWCNFRKLNVQDVIAQEKIINVNWPMDVEIAPAAMMKKKIRNIETMNFETHGVTVLAAGGKCTNRILFNKHYQWDILCTIYQSSENNNIFI